ncbi:FHA domain-containing protein [Simiduia aestuariiviva]|uniref:PSer/pThr/pTyr-binding forkhead associated (FHA) protein n=1 Tax=Simiduia aestuariiviva TaxID=1510459 RepID=A0A839UQ83_9GAMM|nr:FHA domain-containing protein [Simiduia aestuariiviva]MBB3167986.1 pSer/pThr/pTyr-binding forkhead associated (FHA) protein [Simiduia aestuariiviva]
MAQLAQLIDDVVVNKFVLGDEPLTIGRHPDSRVQIDDGAVSSRHAVVLLAANPDFPDFQEVTIEDLGSTNGTRVNGEKIVGRVQLHAGDVVKIGWNEFKLIDHKSKNLASTVHILHD